MVNVNRWNIGSAVETGLCIRGIKGSCRAAGHLAGVGLLVLIGTGCADIIGALDPCATQGACEVDGVSLVFDDLSPDAKMIQEINKQVVSAGSAITVKYTIRNRGSEVSAETGADFYVSGYYSATNRSVTINSLRPGGTASGTITLTLPRDAYGDRVVRGEISGTRTDRPLLIEWPDLISQVELLAEEKQVGTNLGVVVRVQNRSHVAPAPASTAGMCVAGSQSACQTGFEPVRLSVPDLAPGQVWVDTISLELPLTALAWPDVARNRFIGVTANLLSSFEEERTDNNWASRAFVALPNLEKACQVTPITLGNAVSGTLVPTGCPLYVASSPATLYRFDGTANTRYILELTSDLRETWQLDVLTPRGTSIVSRTSTSTAPQFDFTTTSAGTFYLAISSYWGHSTGQQFSVRLTQP
jgi:hypothetical protein